MKRKSVVAAVIEHKGRILCVQRPANNYDYISRKWEFPGGKIEAGETRQESLVREITEELSVGIEVGDLLLTVEHEYPDFHLTMHTFHCTLSPDTRDSDLRLSEHLDLRWLETTDTAFVQLDWAAADVPIVEVLTANPSVGA
jgi:8-oxo-dGTP diphosphatase